MLVQTVRRGEGRAESTKDFRVDGGRGRCGGGRGGIRTHLYGRLRGQRMYAGRLCRAKCDFQHDYQRREQDQARDRHRRGRKGNASLRGLSGADGPADARTPPGGPGHDGLRGASPRSGPWRQSGGPSESLLWTSESLGHLCIGEASERQSREKAAHRRRPETEPRTDSKRYSGP